MGWSIGYDSDWDRDIGYGVPAYCDHPDCNEEIDRGLSFVCGGEPYGGSEGCGLYFCRKHLDCDINESESVMPQLCERCIKNLEPFNPSPEHPEWIEWKLTHESWQQWRDENPEAVKQLQATQ